MFGFTYEPSNLETEDTISFQVSVSFFQSLRQLSAKGNMMTKDGLMKFINKCTLDRFYDYDDSMKSKEMLTICPRLSEVLFQFAFILLRVNIVVMSCAAEETEQALTKGQVMSQRQCGSSHTLEVTNLPTAGLVASYRDC